MEGRAGNGDDDDDDVVVGVTSSVRFPSWLVAELSIDRFGRLELLGQNLDIHRQEDEGRDVSVAVFRSCEWWLSFYVAHPRRLHEFSFDGCSHHVRSVMMLRTGMKVL